MSSNTIGYNSHSAPHNAEMDLGKIIRDARVKVGLTQTALAKQIGVSRSSVSQWEANITTPENPKMKKLAKTLRVDERLLLGLPLNPPAEVPSDSHEGTAVLLDRSISVTQRGELPLTLPIRGTLSTGPGGLFSMGEDRAASYVRRPPRLEGRDDVYGLYVEDTTMQPAFHPGGLVLLEESPPPKIGDDIVIEFAPVDGAGGRPILRHLAGADEDHYILQQLSPPETTKVLRAQVRAIHRVLTMLDLFGK